MGIAVLALVVGGAGWGIFKLLESKADGANESGPQTVVEPTATPRPQSAEPERTAVKAGSDDRQPGAKPMSVKPAGPPKPTDQDAGAERPDQARHQTRSPTARKPRSAIRAPAPAPRTPPKRPRRPAPASPQKPRKTVKSPGATAPDFGY